ncbi:MAG: glycosyltransferase [Armatimonadetes bacterium]|nr:glycosyltransferase [Armatimonadota bacterium]MDE2205691.1 glycosyltransferase [Armatimonadota bacterium]
MNDKPPCRDIVCFAKDWFEDPTSCNHVMQELAKTRRVLWINSISTRAPSLTSGRDVRKIFRKLGSFLKGPTRVSDNLLVATPIVIPMHGSALAKRINHWLLAGMVRRLSRRMHMREYEVWTFVPTFAEYLDLAAGRPLIYYCTDNWKAFSSMDGISIAGMMERTARKADVVFGTSSAIVRMLSQLHPDARLAPHGVDYAQFSAALSPSTVAPADVAQLSHPVLGFYGLIEDWMDQELLVWLAERHPEWNIALIGRVCVDVSRMESLSNIHLLGRKPHSELPAYCKAIDVGLIPHIVNELTTHMNPIKLREYLCAGLPVVATDLPEVKAYGEHCATAADYEAFERAVVSALSKGSPAERAARSRAMADETWPHKVADLRRIIDERCPPPAPGESGGAAGRGRAAAGAR